MGKMHCEARIEVERLFDRNCEVPEGDHSSDGRGEM